MFVFSSSELLFWSLRYWISKDAIQAVVLKREVIRRLRSDIKIALIISNINNASLPCKKVDGRPSSHRCPQDFFQGGQWGGLKDGSLQAGSRDSSPVAVWGQAPRSWRHFVKMIHKYFVYWGFRQHLQQKKHFSTFPVGEHLPLSTMPGDAHASSLTSSIPLHPWHHCWHLGACSSQSGI